MKLQDLKILKVKIENSIDDNKEYDEMDDFDSNINLDSD